MDPLSITASIAGILSLAGSAISAGYTLISKLKNRGDFFNALVNEIATSSGILIGIQAQVIAADTSGSKLQILLHQANVGPTIHDVLESCRKVLEEAQELFNSSMKTNAVQFLIKADAMKEQTDQVISRIEHYKSFFILYLQLLSCAQSDEIGAGVLDMKEQIRDIRYGQKKLQQDVDANNKREFVNKRIQIYQWLGPTTDGEHEEISKRRSPDSAQWILEREELMAWLSSDTSSYFWLCGIQGTGKTVIVSKVIETIKSNFSGDDGVCVGYHYCQFSNSTPPSSERILGAIISQLLLQKESKTQDIPQSLLKLYDKFLIRKTFPTMQELNGLFKELCQSVSKLFLVIDGLDELVDRKEIIQLLQQLSEIPHVDFKVFVASRPEFDLEIAFESYFTIAIKPSDNARDIEQYVRNRVNEFRLQDQNEVVKLIRELVNRADGMFLWVVCQLDQLSRVRTAITTELIQRLPKGLEHMFESGLLKLEDDDRTLALEILRWLMYSRRPLSLEELVEAIAVTPGMENLEQVQKAKVRCASDIFEICGCLIRQSKLSGKLSLAHYSIYEWLSSARLAIGNPNQFYLDPNVSHISMLCTCVTYLSLDDYGSNEFQDMVGRALDEESSGLDLQMLSCSPFLDYASNYWWSHLKEQKNMELDEPVKEILNNFFQQELNFESWVGISRYLHGKYQYPEGMRPIHVAALHGIKCLGIFLIDANWIRRDFTTSDGRRPLHIALESGSDELVDLLVSREASLDVTDTKGQSPLHIAIQSGNTNAVVRLVSAGAEVNTPLPDGGTALSIAIENSWDELATLLSEKASIEPLQDGRYLLHVAVQSGSLVWTTSLLKFHKEILNKTDSKSCTALHYAVDQGHETIVSYLLNENCLPNECDENGWTPLYSAIRRRHYSCAVLLLNTLDNENVRGHILNFPSKASDFERQMFNLDKLSKASVVQKFMDSNEYLEVRDLEFLRYYSGAISTAASKDQSDRPASSPLHVAVSESYSEGMLLLLEHASLCDIGLADMPACLSIALTFPDTTILDTLIAKATHKQIEDILPIIALRNSEKTKSALLERWPAVHAHAILMQTVFSAELSVVKLILNTWPLPSKRLLNNLLFNVNTGFLSQDKKKIFDLIINAGAVFDCLNPSGRSLMQDAIYYENWAFAEFLIEQGYGSGDNPRSSSGETALLFLAECRCRNRDGQMHLLERLVSNGADLNAVDSSGTGVYCKAAAANNSIFLQWLLDSSEPLDDSNVKLQKPMFMAVKCGSKMAAKTLLDKMATKPYQVLEMLRGQQALQSILIAPIEQKNLTMLSLLVGAVNEALELAARAEEYIDIKRTRYTEALCTAIKRRFRPGFDFLLPHLPDVSQADPESGETPLHVAASVFLFGSEQEEFTYEPDENKSDEYYAEALLQNGAHVDAKTLKTDKTALDLALFAGEAKVVETLLRHGAKPKQEHLQKAIETENLNMVASLLDYGTGFNLGQLPLKGVKNPKLAIILLEHGAQLEPSHLTLAAKLGNLPILTEVLEAFPNDRETQLNAFCIAKYRGNPDITSILARQVGETIDEDIRNMQPDSNGGTLLHSAVRRQKLSEVEIILSSPYGSDQEYLLERDYRDKTALILSISCHWDSATLLIRANAGIEEALSWARSKTQTIWIDQLKELIRKA